MPQSDQYHVVNHPEIPAYHYVVKSGSIVDKYTSIKRAQMVAAFLNDALADEEEEQAITVGVSLGPRTIQEEEILRAYAEHLRSLYCGSATILDEGLRDQAHFIASVT